MKKVILLMGIILFSFITGAVEYNTVDYGNTIEKCEGCSYIDGGDYYLMYVDDDGVVNVLRKTIGENTYHDLIVIDVLHPDNIDSGDMYVESGRVHVCITENSSSTYNIYYAGYGTGVTNSSVKSSSAKCSIVEGADTYPHIFGNNDEYRWDGEAWNEDDDVFADANCEVVSDVIMNETNYVALGYWNSAPSYYYSCIETRTTDTGNFVSSFSQSSDVGGHAGVLKMDGTDILGLGGFCTGGTGYIKIGKYNGSNWINSTIIKTLADGANCNKHIWSSALTQLGDTYYAYYSDTDSINNILVSTGDLSGYTETTAISTTNNFHYFSGFSSGEYEYLLYTDNLTYTESIVRIRSASLTFNFSGRVLDGRTMEPIVSLPLVVLESGDNSYSDLCDSNGYYKINNLPEGGYNYTYSDTDYDSVSGSIEITESTTKDVVLYPSDRNISTSNLELSFLNDDSSPFTNETIKFKYIHGCPCLVNNEYYYTTNSHGKIDINIANGEYEISKINHRIKKLLSDDYSEVVYFEFNTDTAKTFWLVNMRALHNVTFIIIDSETGLGIPNATVSLSNGEYFHWNYTNGSGYINFIVTERYYDIIIRHDDYYDYPDIEYYFIDSRIIPIGSTYTEYFLLVPIGKSEYSIWGNITDNNGIAINATVYLEGDRKFLINNTAYSTYNFTNLTVGKTYKLYARKTGFFDSRKELIYLLSDTRYDFVLENITEVTNLFLYLNETNNISAIKAILKDETDIFKGGVKIQYTNMSGQTEFSGIIENHVYELELSKSEYYSNTTTISFHKDNISLEFTMIKENKTFSFSGYIYREGTDYGIKGAKISLGAERDYAGFSDSTGYFLIENIVLNHYILNISKLGYFSKIFIPIYIHDDTIENYYLTIEDDVYGTGFIVKTNQSILLEGVKITIISGDREEYISTNSDGYAEINLPIGKYNILLSKDKYESLNEEIIVTKAGEIFEFGLYPVAEIDFTIDKISFVNIILKYGFIFLLLILAGFVGVILLLLIYNFADLIDRIKKTSSAGIIFITIGLILMILFLILAPLIITFIEKLGNII